MLKRSVFCQKSFATAILKKYYINVQMVTIPGATTFCHVWRETDFFKSSKKKTSILNWRFNLYAEKLQTFRRLRMVAKKVYLPRHVSLRPIHKSVNLTVCPHVSAILPLGTFPWISILGAIMKFGRKIQIWLKSDKSIGQFTIRPKYVLLSSATWICHKSLFLCKTQ